MGAKKKKVKKLFENTAIQKACRWVFEDFVDNLYKEISEKHPRKPEIAQALKDAAASLIIREFGEDDGGLPPEL
jgi:hypothetical protein